MYQTETQGTPWLSQSQQTQTKHSSWYLWKCRVTWTQRKPWRAPSKHKQKAEGLHILLTVASVWYQWLLMSRVLICTLQSTSNRDGQPAWFWSCICLSCGRCWAFSKRLYICKHLPQRGVYTLCAGALGANVACRSKLFAGCKGCWQYDKLSEQLVWSLSCFSRHHLLYCSLDFLQFHTQF